MLNRRCCGCAVARSVVWVCALAALGGETAQQLPVLVIWIAQIFKNDVIRLDPARFLVRIQIQ